ncbi:MAG: hypothetical protein MUE50_25075 [Pirellulaceae bacterium]|nr:hypothetical protein [Pirellulaceae bacterium]MCU0981595.1 hypothetical protein [Pirellulaceae bacterium]
MSCLAKAPAHLAEALVKESWQTHETGVGAGHDFTQRDGFFAQDIVIPVIQGVNLAAHEQPVMRPMPGGLPFVEFDASNGTRIP